jgi:Uma2 family endonuclease
MATAFAAVPHAEDRTMLRNISWETYVRLCHENQSRATQMAYFEGDLEIMTVGMLHEQAKGRIHSMVDAIAEALDIDIEDIGQHTYQHLRKKIGFEADLSYYVTGLAALRSKTKLNLVNDPPPNLVVDVDISRSSQRKLLMYAALGIREVWRCEGLHLRFYRLRGKEYKASRTSILGGVSAAFLTQLLAESWQMTRPKWLKHVRKSVAAE